MSEESAISTPSRSVDTSGGNNGSKVHNAIITTVRFDGTNFFAWSQFALLYISGKDKEAYILDEMVIPNITNPKYRKWKTKNAKTAISHHYLRLKTAKQIWGLVAKTYSKMGNTTKVYELKQSISQSK